MGRLHFCCVECGSLRTTFCTLGLEKPCTCPSFISMHEDCKGPLMERLFHIYDALNHITLRDAERCQVQVPIPSLPKDANVTTRTTLPTTNMVPVMLRRVHCSVCSTHVGYKYVKFLGGENGLVMNGDKFKIVDADNYLSPVYLLDKGRVAQYFIKNPNRV